MCVYGSVYGIGLRLYTVPLYVIAFICTGQEIGLIDLCIRSRTIDNLRNLVESLISNAI